MTPFRTGFGGKADRNQVIDKFMNGSHNETFFMSQAAIDTLSTFGVGVLCIALGVMALTIFFTSLSWFASRGARPETLSVRGVLKKDTWATVHMTGAKSFDRVRFVGFTDTQDMKTHLPFDLNGMVILEDRERRRYLVRAKAIRMIVIDPAAEGDKNKGV